MPEAFPHCKPFKHSGHSLAGNRGTLIGATHSTEVDRTLDRLVVWEIVIGGGTILLPSALGWLVTWVALRLLSHIEDTAGGIADGDFSPGAKEGDRHSAARGRVDRTNPRTEVGRLGISLSKMLMRIEGAFAAREASEQRLRQFLSDASHEL